MLTEKIYQKDMYLREAEATVVSAEGRVLVLDATIFAPDAGGQPCDVGTIGGVRVAEVHEEKGIISHIMAEDLPETGFAPGDRVSMVIDWNVRFDHMQNHLGEHILSAIFKKEYDLDNKGFHLGEEDGTFDIDAKEISREMLDRVEDLANEVVRQAIPVEIIFIDSAEEALKLPLRKELKAEEDISIVTVPGVDCVACCCPHPSDTSQIGLIKLLKTEKYKGMTRIHYKCGLRALRDYQQKHRVMAALCEKYSADEFTLPDKVAAADEKNEAQHRELNRMRDMLADLRAGELLMASGFDKEGSCSGDSKPGLVCGIVDRAEMDDLRKIVKKITDRVDVPVVAASDYSLSVILAHSGKSPVKCGALVKEFALGAGGKGGGSDVQAQVIFKDQVLMHNFIEIVKASVR